jgi:hypothetical protein
MKNAIVTFANEHGNYLKGLERLRVSLRGKFDGNFFGFVGEENVGAPKHEDDPYAFKVYAIDLLVSSGYTKILWLDSSVYAVKNVMPVFDEIKARGYIMQEAGHMAGSWCNDATLRYFGLTRRQAMEMPMYGNAGMLGLDMEHDTARDFFERWKQSMQSGCFKGSWLNHRHDMSCGSIIANMLGMQYVRGDEWLQYGGESDAVLNDTIVFKAQGM